MNEMAELWASSSLVSITGLQRPARSTGLRSTNLNTAAENYLTGSEKYFTCFVMFGPMLNIINLRAAVRDELDTVNATDDTEDTINEDAVANNDMLGLHLQLTEKLYNKKERSKYYNLKIIVSVLFISVSFLQLHHHHHHEHDS